MRERASVGLRRYLARLSPAERAARQKKMASGLPPSEPSSIERAVREQLDRLGVTYQPQYPVGPYVLDIFVPASNADIECDGCYWHGCVACGFPTTPDRGGRDRARDEYLRAYGFRVVRLKEHDIRSDAATATREALNRIGL